MQQDGGLTDLLLPSLTASGHYLTDGAGNVVILRGFNLCTKTAQTPEQLGFDRRIVQFMKDWGVSVVRLGVPWANSQPYYQNDNGTLQYDTQFLASIKRTIQLLAEFEIYTLVDFHQDAYSVPWGFGAPSWAIPAGGSNTPQVGWVLNTFGGNDFVVEGSPRLIETDLNFAFDTFWNDAPIRQTHNDITFWEAYGGMLQYVSAYLNDQAGNILGYDPINEPEPGSLWTEGYVPDPTNLFNFPNGFPTADATLGRFYQQCAIPNLRSGHPEAMVWFEPYVYFDYNAPTYLGDMGAPNVGFNFHNYDNSDGDNSFLTPVRNAQGYQNSYNVPLLCSEFGGTNDTTVINTIADINDQNMLSAIFWAWFNNARFFFAENTNPVVMGVLQNMWGELAPPNLNQDMLTAVSRVYPRTIAGTPQNFGTDANDTFTFTYSTTKPNGQIGTDPTVIVVPAGLYPNDFTVTASGATWSRGDGTVLITPDSPTPASITVTIEPLS